MAKGQKEAVVELVKAALPGFIEGHHVALTLLSSTQLESIKATIGQEIMAGNVAYGKDPSNKSEVISYARSMVMNHLKKAKELNGGQTNRSASSGSTAKPNSTTKGINLEILPEELKEYVTNL